MDFCHIIDDLSIYGLGIANNGGGTDGQEYTFPNVSVNSGDHILICRDSLQLSNYLSTDCFAKFSLVIEDGAVNHINSFRNELANNLEKFQYKLEDFKSSRKKINIQKFIAPSQDISEVKRIQTEI